MATVLVRTSEGPNHIDKVWEHLYECAGIYRRGSINPPNYADSTIIARIHDDDAQALCRHEYVRYVRVLSSGTLKRGVLYATCGVPTCERVIDPREATDGLCHVHTVERA